MLAYSQPITPAPTTANVRGSRSRSRTSSLVKMRSPSNGICGSRVVSAPAAMTILLALTVRELRAVDILEADGVRRDKGGRRAR